MIANLEEMPHGNGQPSLSAIARLERVSKNYGEVKALREINLEIRAGELLALLGPNAAGKTTAVKLLLGLARPDRGKVSVFGLNPLDSESRIRTGAMLQVARVPETLRVREHIDLFRAYYPSPLPASQVLALTGLTEVKNRLFGELSGGQRQRVLFALALCGDPDLLFLDEPTVGLDVEARRALWEEIRKLLARGKTILLTTHYLEEADALADRIVVLHKGSVIAEGPPAEIKAKTAGRRVRCRTNLTAEFVRRLPGVISVRQDRGALEIQASEAEPVLRGLLASDQGLSGIEVASAGLEEAFLALTQDARNQSAN